MGRDPPLSKSNIPVDRRTTGKVPSVDRSKFVVYFRGEDTLMPKPLEGETKSAETSEEINESHYCCLSRAMGFPWDPKQTGRVSLGLGAAISDS